MGNCYEANAKKILFDAKFEKATLVHGVAMNSQDNKPMGHCWLEIGDTCYDFANEKAWEVEKALYYEVGLVKTYLAGGYKIYKYTKKQVQENIVTIGHWGAWEETGCQR